MTEGTPSAAVPRGIQGTAVWMWKKEIFMKTSDATYFAIAFFLISTGIFSMA